MKKILCLLLVLLLLATPGCAEPDEADTVRSVPALTAGTMNCEQLTKGSCVRENYIPGLLEPIEIESGYYLDWGAWLFYAEKTNLDAWYYVCNNPNCRHQGSTCSAWTGSSAYLYKDNRLWFCADRNDKPQLLKEGLFLASMDTAGEDVRAEHVFDWENFGSEAAYSTTIYSGGYMIGCQVLQPDGTYRQTIYLVDLEKGTKKVFETVVDEQPPSSPPGFGKGKLCLSGDISIEAYWFTNDLSYTDLLCWFRDGEAVFTDVSQIPVTGGYLQENIVRCLYPGDGYYDVDLLTGEKTKLADAQLTESKAMILQPNCIIETTLLNPEANVEVQEMRFFDGVRWHTVALPEEMRNAPDDTFEVVMLASDRVIFSVKRNGEAPGYYGLKSSRIFYQMELEATEYQVTYMGTFTMPTA